MPLNTQVFKEYGLVFLIFTLCLLTVPPLLMMWLGSLLGYYAGIIATGITLILAYWLLKRMQKSMGVKASA